MPLTDEAYWPGDEEDPAKWNRPRCKATPGKADIAANRAMRRDTWECTLPAGHEKYTNPRHRPHSWVQTAEQE